MMETRETIEFDGADGGRMTEPDDGDEHIFEPGEGGDHDPDDGTRDHRT
jgi:hypothetical protein